MTIEKMLSIAFPKAEADEMIHAIREYDKKLLRKNKMLLRLNEVFEIADLIDFDPVELTIEILKPRCRNCGCTDMDCSQCIERTGEPCHWVEDDLCSACVSRTSYLKPRTSK